MGGKLVEGMGHRRTNSGYYGKLDAWDQLIIRRAHNARCEYTNFWRLALASISHRCLPSSSVVSLKPLFPLQQLSMSEGVPCAKQYLCQPTRCEQVEICRDSAELIFTHATWKTLPARPLGAIEVSRCLISSPLVSVRHFSSALVGLPRLLTPSSFASSVNEA
jgi:hypothetical protein